MEEDSFTNYYEVLECDKTSTAEELKKCYQRLVLSSHPDKTNTSDERFVLIQKAWSVLRDPESRKQYDAELSCREHSDHLLYDTISLSEMNYDKEEKLHSFSCRCGGMYLLEDGDSVSDKMPRNRPRTTTKAKWNKEDLEKAVRAVRDGVSIRKASKIFMIPFSTLQERIKKNLPITAPSLGIHATFSPEEEKGMAENIKLLAKLYYGLSPLQVRRAAYIYADKHNIKHTFNKERQMAGKDWLYGFLKRNPSIFIRQPEATSINRVTAFNKEEVALFFKNLEGIMETYQFAASKIYNMDETGISTVQDPGTVIAEKGQKRVGSVTSYERGKNITVICAVSASGSYIPPMFIYPRKRMSPQLSKDGPNEAIYHCSKNGWTNQDLFVIWLKHFVQFARPSSAEPMLLVLDNHYSHVSLEAYTFCRENFIVVLSIPPHTSHRMQPLDVAFYGPLKAAFRRQCDLFMKSHALLKITPYDVASIFNKAYCDTATIQKGVSGFKASGIMPIDPTVFGEEDFMASDYLLGSRNDTVTVMNDSTANPMNHDQATSTFPLEANNLPGPSAQVAIAPEANNLPETSDQ